LEDAASLVLSRSTDERKSWTWIAATEALGAAMTAGRRDQVQLATTCLERALAASHSNIRLPAKKRPAASVHRLAHGKRALVRQRG